MRLFGLAMASLSMLLPLVLKVRRMKRARCFLFRELSPSPFSTQESAAPHLLRLLSRCSTAQVSRWEVVHLLPA